MAQGALRGAPARASRIAWTSAIVLGTLALFVPSALAVHSIGLFEVDGNASEQSPVGEDWEIMFPVMGPTNSTAQVFVQDVGEILTVIGGSGGSFFAGGSSKDDINSTSWLWNGPGPQDKGNISDAYAAVYEANGNQYVFFGMDRFDNNGDVAVSFWFFQDDIAPIIDGDGDYVFSAGHTTGDILIQTAYTNGGVIGTISVYRWNDADAAAPTGPLDLIATGLDCTNPALPAGHIACGRVNAGLEPSPWPFESKPNNNAPSDTFQPRGFLEIGLNLTQALGGADQCLGTFIAETRSSQTIDSTLKDFALGSFNTCQPEAIVDLSKVAANTPVGYGDDVVFDIEVSNLGPDEANFVTLVDNLTEISGNWTVSGADAGDCSIDESGTPDVLTCDFGTMLFPSSKTITLTGGTGGDPADCGAVPNSADLTWDSGTATDSDTVTVQCGNIVVDKVCDPVSDTTTSFDFDPSWTSDLDVVCGGSEDSGPLAPGAYSVSETALAGWDLIDTDCVSSLENAETAGSLD
ncbi:MAG TPA: hypothetical protein VI997_08685, partial [Candidatus Thermoplasmatota archaeon]|nr:hypothetical protein [Candidatus Thermoplasmatota archaeon]